MLGEMSEDFAVYLDIGFFELIDELGVGSVIDSGSGIDLDLP